MYKNWLTVIFCQPVFSFPPLFLIRKISISFSDYNPENYIDFVDYAYGEMAFIVVTPDNYLDMLA